MMAATIAALQRVAAESPDDDYGQNQAADILMSSLRWPCRLDCFSNTQLFAESQ